MCIPWKSDAEQNEEKKAAGGLDPGSGDKPVAECPIKYAIRVTVMTRVGEIPLPGLAVKVDGSALGTTDSDGKTGPGPLRDEPTVDLEVIYYNAGEKLKKEVFSLKLTGVSGPGQTATPGNGKNFISKVRDVLGTGSAALSGDKDFSDEYGMGPQIAWEAHPDGKNKVIHITVKMATLSVLVPYISQNMSNETITITPPNTKNTWNGWALCMPTSTTMVLNYWGVQLDGAEVTRNAMLQHTWNVSPTKNTGFPSPWQIWGELHNSVKSLLPATLANKTAIPGVTTPADKQTVPSAFADEIAKRLAKGEPMVVSTDATDGHVMVIRGAVVDHDGRAQWLIYNDPYGNLSSEKSVYGVLDIASGVGLGTETPINQKGDVEAVQSALKELGYYSGEVNGECSSTDREDPTVKAILKFQGANGDGLISPGGGTEKKINTKLKAMKSTNYSNKEEEINPTGEAGADKGKHAYYNNETAGKFTTMQMQAHDRFLILVRTPSFTKNEVRDRLVPGAGE